MYFRLGLLPELRRIQEQPHTEEKVQVGGEELWEEEETLSVRGNKGIFYAGNGLRA